jgi:hypothetical protein
MHLWDPLAGRGRVTAEEVRGGRILVLVDHSDDVNGKTHPLADRYARGTARSVSAEPSSGTASPSQSRIAVIDRSA